MSEATTATQAASGSSSCAATDQSATQAAATDGLDHRRTVSKEEVAPDDDATGCKADEYAGDDEMGLVTDRRQSREWGAFPLVLVCHRCPGLR
jgi:hypothetical protein